MSIKMSEKKKSRTNEEVIIFWKIKWSDRWFYPDFLGVGVIGMEIQKKQTEEKEGNLTKK